MGDFKREPLDQETRFYIFERDNFKCEYCGKSKKDDDDVILHVDHINPVSNGGNNLLCNLVTSCSKCNMGKGAKILTEKNFFYIARMVCIRTLWHNSREQHQDRKMSDRHKKLFNAVTYEVITNQGLDALFDAIELSLSLESYIERVMFVGWQPIEEFYQKKHEKKLFEE